MPEKRGVMIIHQALAEAERGSKPRRWLFVVQADLLFLPAGPRPQQFDAEAASA